MFKSEVRPGLTLTLSIPSQCVTVYFCWVCRTLSCAACYGVTDVGIACLSSCHQLSDLNISYCHMARSACTLVETTIRIIYSKIMNLPRVFFFATMKVTDQGLSKLLHSDMKRLCVRACQGVTDSGKHVE